MYANMIQTRLLFQKTKTKLIYEYMLTITLKWMSEGSGVWILHHMGVFKFRMH